MQSHHVTCLFAIRSPGTYGHLCIAEQGQHFSKHGEKSSSVRRGITSLAVIQRYVVQIILFITTGPKTALLKV